MRCLVCGGELTQKSRLKLLASGLGMLPVAVAFPAFAPVLWIAAALLVIVAAYLITWSTLGKGLWCRQCKTVPGSLKVSS
jgi:hypothetical protein